VKLFQRCALHLTGVMRAPAWLHHSPCPAFNPASISPLLGASVLLHYSPIGI